MSQEHTSGICGLWHLALKVTDLPRSLKFYQNLFGMRIVWQPDADNVYLSSGLDNLALHQMPRSDMQDYTDRRVQLMDHFGVIMETPEAVDRLFTQVERVRAQVTQLPKRHRDGSYSFYVADPDGNVVQVLFDPNISRGLQSQSKK